VIRGPLERQHIIDFCVLFVLLACLRCNMLGGGSLSVDSVPSGAAVHLWGPNGDVSSWNYETPHTFSNLPAGEYYLMLEKDGYYEWHAIEYEEPQVVAGRLTTVTAYLVPTFSQGTNVALAVNGATASASGWTSYGGYGARPDQANDGVADVSQGRTFWANSALPSWLTIELPSVTSVRSIGIHQNYHDLTYKVESSIDGSNWSVVVPSTFTPHSGRTHTLSNAVAAKYFRFTVTGSSAPYSHLWKTNVYELELWEN